MTLSLGMKLPFEMNLRGHHARQNHSVNARGWSLDTSRGDPLMIARFTPDFAHTAITLGNDHPGRRA
jgi:hypothetical protein